MTDDKRRPDEGQGLDEADVTQDLEIKDAEEADGVKGGWDLGKKEIATPGTDFANHSERVLP